MTKPKPGDIVMVVWDDACALMDRVLIDTPMEMVTVKSVGVVKDINKKRIVIHGDTYHFEPTTLQVDRALVIPMGCISKIFKLRSRGVK